MKRPLVIIICLAVVALVAFRVLLQTPGSLNAALVHPFYALLGTQQSLNSTLYDVSETAEPVRAASRRLLKPLGVVRLVRSFDILDPDSARNKKNKTRPAPPPILQK
jgi:hypothetical protein